MFGFLKRLKSNKEIPWYAQGYVKFPEDIDEVPIVLTSGKIIRINNETNTISIEDNKGMYSNTVLLRVEL